MNRDFHEINPWAGKLDQITIPDAAGSWMKMRAILDREMPLSKNKRVGRWIMVVVFLLLLVGVCHCPGLLERKGEALTVVQEGAVQTTIHKSREPKINIGNNKNSTPAIIGGLSKAAIAQ
jgi:hypothetical protein